MAIAIGYKLSLMKTKTIAGSLLVFLAGGLCIILYQHLTLPVKFEVCKSGYVDCFLVGRFTDMNSCQVTNNDWNLACDNSDPQHITCSTVPDTTAVGYCAR